jgi:hypothetical protein
MPDKSTAAADAKARRAAAVDRMAALAAEPAPEVTAERSERSKQAAAERRRKAPATTARTVRAAPMPTEQAKAPAYSARVSHTTSVEQLEALEEVSRQARRATGQAVPLTSLIRAACQICLDDARLRDRMQRLARTEWR